jgi:C4-dicarboxylate-specific signal transduction histidine kinase
MKLPQLTLRDLFWLVLFCAVLITWWMERQRLVERIAELEKAAAIQAALKRARVTARALELQNVQLQKEYESAARKQATEPPTPFRFDLRRI